MNYYLHIEFMDGTKEVCFYDTTSGSSISVDESMLRLHNGDGSYSQRGKIQAWPLHNIRRYWTSKRADEEA